MANTRNVATDYQDIDGSDICIEEVSRIVASLQKRKATANDRVPNEAIPKIV